ncbi:MAG: CHAD domain-containing protein [Nitrososphaeraceae archaeon]
MIAISTMPSLLTAKHFASKMDENIKRVESRDSDYIKDSNETNIHDIRTAVRRLDATYKSLPRKLRRKNRVSKYMATSKRLFKLNSQIRDYDIIGEKLQKYSSNSGYKNIAELLKKRRETKLASARKAALSLRDRNRPQINENDIPPSKLEARFNKIVSRLVESIELDLPVVLTNPDKTKELHELRKDCKKLRYLLELIPHHDDNNSNDKKVNSKDINAMITTLEDIQDILGSIHDNDTMISFLKQVSRKNKNKKDVNHILHDEISERAKKYEDLIQFCKRNLSDNSHNFLKQIALMG